MTMVTIHKAKTQLSKLIEQFPSSPFAADAQMKIARRAYGEATTVEESQYSGAAVSTARSPEVRSSHRATSWWASTRSRRGSDS